MATNCCSDDSDKAEEKKEGRCRGEEAAGTMTCDYLVIGGGATGMAFVDSLLTHCSSAPPETGRGEGGAGDGGGPSVIVVDRHAGGPGGQWHDSYSFVRLHQPSRGYGVETDEMDPSPPSDGIPPSERHRATRAEVLEYYGRVRRTLEAKYDFRFIGGATFDVSSLDAQAHTPTASGSGADKSAGGGGIPHRIHLSDGDDDIVVRVAKRVVDARFLEPDLPVSVPPKFSYDQDSITCVPINSLVGPASSGPAARPSKHYVVIGGGKTGMDAITFLQTELSVDPDNIMWIVPNEVWITARESIGSCMEFLNTCTEIAKRKKIEQKGSDKVGEQTGGAEMSMEQIVKSDDFFQNGFLEWERLGKVYRLDKETLPTKFKDATLCREEMALIKKVTKVIHHGRVKAISNSGDLLFVDGTKLPLPWLSEGASVKDTTFVHCSAGAFNYTKQPDSAPPVFAEHVITIQDVYGTPGFCFVGSVIGKLESMGDLTDEEKNAMCLAPEPDASQAKLPLGPSGGDVGVISKNHGYVQRLSNLKSWLDIPDMKKWLVGHRLFNLGHLDAEEMTALVEQTWDVLREAGLVE